VRDLPEIPHGVNRIGEVPFSIGPLCVIDYEDLRPIPAGLEPQAELLLKCGEDGWPRAVGLARIKRIELQMEVEEAGKPSPIKRGASRNYRRQFLLYERRLH
jgi:hypothetical protein